MIPGLGGMNPAQMKAMMRQLGIKSEDLDAEKVTITLTDGRTLVFDSPHVNAMDMKGQKTYTITGDAREEAASSPGTRKFSQDDVEMVMDQAHCNETEATDALRENDGDIAEAIASLKK